MNPNMTPRCIKLGSAKRLTRACLLGTFLEPLNPTLYFKLAA
ncbi:hypothetical protein [Caulobacter sp. 602-2]|nr:hypothetical protein [Caulobacter sp. 602-2]